MTMKKRKYILSILMICVSLVLRSQDFTFSQFYEMPLLRNPAIAGLFAGDVRIQSAYRNQWASVTVPYRTMALSAEVKLPVGYSDDYFTGSLQLSNDQAGDSKLSRIQILPSVSYLKSLNDENGYIAVGFMGGIIQSQFDPTKLTFNDQFQNGSFNPNNATSQIFRRTSVSYFDASAGVSYSNMIGYATKFYVGAAYYHFNKPKVSFFNDETMILKPRLVFNAGLSMPTSDYDDFYIYGDYLIQGGHRQALMGLMYGHILTEFEEDDRVCLYLGGFYRWADAFVPVAKLEIHKVCIGVSYDVNTSKLRTASQFRGGIELTASYRTYLNIRSSSRDKVKCPVPF